MFATRVYHYRDPAAVILGLKELRKQGLTPRGLLFVALDPRGETYIAIYLTVATLVLSGTLL